ncbi:chemotaxis protein CheW [Allobacillus sp. GCM10007491]|uniref:Chemotaxis protein CheA n=1 Tax=Allobacillus saliphilus TaxID=2912308 RepID=A0A941HT42_9BACI|nr:chemotaxis protein CheA [Allobacillus saliphilus]MBR7552909.1 chemotaxis protein CheA [Allobacillus saliphilus]
METNQYLGIFIDESNENLQKVNDGLLDLEKDPTNMEHIEVIFRAAHTLKGMSATMGYEDLTTLTHQMEDVLDLVRNSELAVSAKLLDILLNAVEKLEEMVGDISAGGDGKSTIQPILNQLKAIDKSEEITNEMVTSNEDGINGELTLDSFEETVINQANSEGLHTYHLTIQLTDDCLLKAARVYMVFEILEKEGEVIKSVPSVETLESEEFDHQFDVVFVTSVEEKELNDKIMKVSEIKQVSIQPIKSLDNHEDTDNKEVNQTPSKQASMEVQNNSKSQRKQSANKTIRVNIDRLDALMNLFEELVIDRGRLEQIAFEMEHGDLTETVGRMSRISSDLQSIILTMRMVPIEQVFNRFPRMVRQLTRELNKDIQLDIEGAETELDRTVIDEIGDPLVHLIRNSLDHGIEMPEVREKNGKNRQGHVLLKAYHSGNHVYVEISDDGQGINREKVLNKALENQVVTPEQANQLSDRQIDELILASGFSTADEVSDLSGRGVGLDVVKNTIESLGGTIEITSEEGEGTTFTIQLPLTLSIISVMLSTIGSETYAVPLSTIIETAMIKQEEIVTIQGQQMMHFRESVIPLIFLREVLNVPDSNNASDKESVIIVRKGEQVAGLVVDSLIGQQEVVLKNLGNYLNSIFAISGATILGDGEVALIIDTHSLIK